MDGSEDDRVSSNGTPPSSPPPPRPLAGVRDSWDVILSLFGLVGLTVTWLSPVIGLAGLQSPTAWAIFAGAAQILPASRIADRVLGGGRP